MYSSGASGTAQFVALSTKSHTRSPAVILATAMTKAHIVAYTSTNLNGPIRVLNAMNRSTIPTMKSKVVGVGASTETRNDNIVINGGS